MWPRPPVFDEFKIILPAQYPVSDTHPPQLLLIQCWPCHQWQSQVYCTLGLYMCTWWSPGRRRLITRFLLSVIIGLRLLSSHYTDICTILINWVLSSDIKTYSDIGQLNTLLISPELPYTSFFRPATDGPIQVICFPSAPGLPSYVTDGKYWKMRPEIIGSMPVWTLSYSLRSGIRPRPAVKGFSALDDSYKARGL